MSMSKRLAVLEAAQGEDPELAAKAEADRKELQEFLKTTFPAHPMRSWTDELANCCGLPSAQYLSFVLDGGGTAEAFATTAQRAAKQFWMMPGVFPEHLVKEGPPSEDWQALMRDTAEQALEVVYEKHGDEGLGKLARLFPLIANAMKAIGVAEGGAAT